MIGFPLLLIPFAIYNIFVFLMPGVAFTSPIVDVPLLSGVTWTPTFGDSLLVLALLLLLIEVIKASRPGGRYLMDHLLSLIVFGAAVAEFLLLAPFGTSTFLLLTVLTGVEFLSGLSLGLRNRRRKTQVAAEPAPPPSVQATVPPASPSIPEPPAIAVPETPAPAEPAPEPASSPQVPAAQSESSPKP